MKNTHAILIRLLLSCLMLAMGAPWQLRAADEATSVSVTDNFEQHIPAAKGHGKTDLFGASAEPVHGGGDKVLIKNARIEQFPLNGDKPEIIAESPACVWDLKSQVVNSSDQLRVHGQDGKLFVEGRGFLLLQKDFMLTISNQVHTIIKNQSGANSPLDPGTEIFADHGHFEMKTGATNGLAIYRDNVRVVDPRMKLWSEILTAELPRSNSGSTNRPRHIVAETNVVIDFVNERGETTRAIGDKAIYDYQVSNGATNEVLDLTGSPKVQLTNGWMIADTFSVNRATGKLIARGDCHFHYESPPGGVAVGLSKTNPSGAPSDIFSDNFEFDNETRVANFWGKVRVEGAQMLLRSATLAAELPRQGINSSRRIEHILAETNVVIDFTDEKSGQHLHATGEKATYEYRVKDGITNEILALSGNPEVQTFAPHAGWMTADLITADRAQGKLWGTGNHHSVFKKQPGEFAALDTEIFSDTFEFTLATGLAEYHGKVRAFDPSMNLTGNELIVTFNKTGEAQLNSIQRADARGAVVIDVMDHPFSANDITNFPAFAGRLQKGADPVASYVASQLSARDRSSLTNYTVTINDSLRASLITDLNRIVQSGSVYDAARFSNVFLSLETSQLLKKNPSGVELTVLNRLLILDAFRGELARNSNGEKVHATGDAAAYVTQGGVATNAFLKLSGHPRLETPTRWITADESITDDRNSGVYHALGNPIFHTKLQGFAQHKPRGTNSFPTK